MRFFFDGPLLKWEVGLGTGVATGEASLSTDFHLLGYSFDASEDKLTVWMDDQKYVTDTSSATLTDLVECSYTLVLKDDPYGEVNGQKQHGKMGI